MYNVCCVHVKLFGRVSTGENWQEVMLDCTDGQPCHERAEANKTSCGSNFAYFFFPSFFFLTSILVCKSLHLLIVIIVCLVFSLWCL